MKLDLEEEGLKAFGFKDWQEPLIHKLLTSDIEMKTGEAHEYVLGKGFKISRASVINFLFDQKEEGTLASREEYGKGGSHFIYRRAKNLPQFIVDVRVQFADKMLEAAEMLGLKS